MSIIAISVAASSEFGMRKPRGMDTVITDDGLDPDSVGKTRDLVKELVLAHQNEPIQEGE